jgi:hypothetical protein
MLRTSPTQNKHFFKKGNRPQFEFIKFMLNWKIPPKLIHTLQSLV